MEIWADIKGFEGHYQVSNHGRVKSIERQVSCRGNSKRTIQDSIRTPVYNKANKAYSIRLVAKAKKKHCLIADLVAQAFVENPNNLPKLIHIDGNKLNDHASNLAYVDNMGRYVAAQFKTKKHHKLTDFDRITIKKRRSANETYRSIASDYGISITTVSNICCESLPQSF